MLSVNFLAPQRVPNGRSLARRQFLAGLAAAVMLIGLVAWTWAVFAHVAELRRELSAVTTKAAALRESSRPQMRASQIIGAARAAVPGNVWLTGMTVAGDQVIFEGYAHSYSLIAGFMTGLQHSGIPGTVALAMSQRETRAGEEVVKFRITAGPTQTHAAAGSTNGRAP